MTEDQQHTARMVAACVIIGAAAVGSGWPWWWTFTFALAAGALSEQLRRKP